MPTLTPDDIADIRLVIGAPDCGDTAQITPSLIQRQYDIATANAPSSDLVLPYTYVYLLQRMKSIYGAAYVISRTTDHGDNERYTDPRKGIETDLAYWEQKAGLFGGTMQTGSLNLGLDTTQEWIESQLND